MGLLCKQERSLRKKLRRGKWKAIHPLRAGLNEFGIRKALGRTIAIHHKHSDALFKRHSRKPPEKFGVYLGYNSYSNPHARRALFWAVLTVYFQTEKSKITFGMLRNLRRFFKLWDKFPIKTLNLMIKGFMSLNRNLRIPVTWADDPGPNESYDSDDPRSWR